MDGKRRSACELAEVLTPSGPEPSPSVLLPSSNLGLHLSWPLRHSGIHVHLVPVTHEGADNAHRFHSVDSDGVRSVVVSADLLAAASVAVAGPVWWRLPRRSIPLIALAADVATVLLRCGLEVVPLLSEDTEATAASIIAIARPLDGRVVLVGGRRRGPRLAEYLRRRGLQVRVNSIGALDDREHAWQARLQKALADPQLRLAILLSPGDGHDLFRLAEGDLARVQSLPVVTANRLTTMAAGRLGFAVQVEAAAPTVARLTEAVFSALGSFHKTDLPPSA